VAGKTRSRNYPAFGLPDAIQRARQLYDREKRATVDADVAVQAWGYGGLNGASLRVLGAMKQYGLLDSPAPKSVKLSHDAVTILLEPEDSEERAESLRRVAQAPAMFAEIRQQYPHDLPSDTALVSWLVRTHGFNDDAAESLIAAYRDTLSLVEENGKRDIAPRKDRADDGRRDSTGDHPARNPGGQMKELVYSYRLPGGAAATLTLEGGPLGEAAVRLLGSFFELVKQGLLVDAETRMKSQSAPAEATGAD
jgi:hypothetical protein